MSYANAYKKTQAETASPQRLMALLFQAALRHIREGAQGLETKQIADCRTHFSKASAIVTELARTLDPQKSPELAAELGPLYLFVSRRLYMANLKYDVKAAREAERVFAPIAEAFSQAVAQAQAVAP
jgi:flagellar protein FliS